MTDIVSFLRSIEQPNLTSLDRAKAILWWVARDGNGMGMPVGEICKLIEAAGHPRQNSSRLNSQLSADKKMVNHVPGSDAWRLHPHGEKEMDSLYQSISGRPTAPKESDSVLPRAIFTGTRGYIEKVVNQINGSYDCALYDCTAVMCRRLLETLLIEVYENAGRPSDIKGPDGNYLMFAGLLSIFEADSSFQLSRNSQKGLRDFKKLGDLSAHNRRFNAQKSDIDKISSDIRVASEELLHLARLI